MHPLPCLHALPSHPLLRAVDDDIELALVRGGAAAVLVDALKRHQAQADAAMSIADALRNM